MNDGSIDILAVTYNRPHYTKLSLQRLLDTCDQSMRVWIWHNGNDAETLGVVRSLATHPRVHCFHHSPENKKLREPTNWLWKNSTGQYVCKLDDDCLLPSGWAQTLRAAHEANPKLGVIGCWRFCPEDFRPDIAGTKIHELAGGHRLLRNLWVDDSGFLMKRECIESIGLLRHDEWFDGRYCIRLAQAGWLIGWYYPFIMQDHMDDPRSPNTGVKTDADVIRTAPLTAQRNGICTVAAWDEMLRRTALHLQSAPLHIKYYTGWRRFAHRAAGRIKRTFGIKEQW